MTDTIKKGTVLWAIDPATSDGVNRLTIGKSYEVVGVMPGRFLVICDQGWRWYFLSCKGAKYFSLTPPEDKGVQTEGKSEDPEITRLRAENDRLRREIETLKAKW